MLLAAKLEQVAAALFEPGRRRDLARIRDRLKNRIAHAAREEPSAPAELLRPRPVLALLVQPVRSHHQSHSGRIAPSRSG
jgi:hypothetical protein